MLKSETERNRMNKIGLLLAGILLLGSLTLHAQSSKVTIHGKVPDYAGTTLTFMSFVDQVTYTKDTLATVTVTENGTFKASFSVEQTRYVFLLLGVYEGYFFVEPGQTYAIELPERQNKSQADLLNPYFEPTSYHLGIEDVKKEELNYAIAWFDSAYEEATTTYAYAFYQSKSDSVIKVLTERLEDQFAHYEQPYFRQYVRYKLALLRYNAFQEKSTSISNNYFLHQPIRYQNIAYMELFHQVYDDYFEYFGRTSEGSDIYPAINRYGSYTAVDTILAQNKVLENDTLKELVMLKCLYDEFYDDSFSRRGMLAILDTLEQQTSLSQHKVIAQRVRERVTRLLPGYEPPGFALYNRDSSLVTLDDFQGRYVYLGFCTSMSYACIQEFEMLRSLQEQFKQYFDIVMICADKNLATMRDFVNKKGYDWTFLHYGNQSNVLQKYDVRAFPTYYFIDDEGKLLMSPAPSPAENLEIKVFEILRDRGALQKRQN